MVLGTSRKGKWVVASATLNCELAKHITVFLTPQNCASHSVWPVKARCLFSLALLTGQVTSAEYLLLKQPVAARVNISNSFGIFSKCSGMFKFNSHAVFSKTFLSPKKNKGALNFFCAAFKAISGPMPS